MITKKTFLLFFGCVILFSCKNSKTIPIIDLDRIEQSTNLDITDILKDITAVQISSDFVLSVNDRVYVTSKYLIIYHNRGASLDLFSRDGKHIRKLAERGNGPGEFNRIQYFFVDEEESILYYNEQGWPRTRLYRIDISSGKAFEPLQIDFTYLMPKYMNGKLFGLPSHILLQPTDGSSASIDAGEYPDSSVVAVSISLPSGEMEKYRGQHKYSFLILGSSITSYYDEISLFNLGYSDTLFTLKDKKLSPLCILHLSKKVTSNEDTGRSGCEIISAYNNGIVLSKINIKPTNRDFFALYDRKGNIKKIDNTLVMGAKINLTDSKGPFYPSYLLPISCGKFGYMLVEHDVLKNVSKDFDSNNDNPIIIVGELK